MDLYNKNKSKFYQNIERPEINKTEGMKKLIKKLILIKMKL